MSVTSDRRLEVPVWMFDRAATQGWQVGATPVASVTALGALVALLHDAADICDRAPPSRDSSAASESQEVIPEMPKRRRLTPQQLELFARPSDVDLVPAPHWETLPAEARVTLTELIVRLILDHNGVQAPHLTEARHEA